MTKPKNSKARERKRAEVVHELFSRYEEKIQASTLKAVYPEIARELRGQKFPFSLKSCYRWYDRWKASPEPASVARNYATGGTEKYSDISCRAVIIEAIARRISVRAAAKLRKGGPSYRSLHYRFPEMIQLVSKLAELKNTQNRLNATEQALMDSFFKA